jgi:hypothetical protein
MDNVQSSVPSAEWTFSVTKWEELQLMRHIRTDTHCTVHSSTEFDAGQTNYFTTIIIQAEKSFKATRCIFKNNLYSISSSVWLIFYTSMSNYMPNKRKYYGIGRDAYATPLYPQKLVLTSPTSGCRSVGIVRSCTKATELLLLLLLLCKLWNTLDRYYYVVLNLL